MQKICIITVVDSVATTSMPVNEFVLYRRRKKYPFRQELISCTEGNANNVLIPEDITTHFVGNDKTKMRETLKKIILSCDDRGEKTLYHLHAQKSAMLFYTSSGLGIRNRTLFTIHVLIAAGILNINCPVVFAHSWEDTPRCKYIERTWIRSEIFLRSQPYV